jgi:hypothetical protein
MIDTGWEIIRKRAEREARAVANRRAAWSMDETTGTVRQDEDERTQSSFIEMCLAEPNSKLSIEEPSNV